MVVESPLSYTGSAKRIWRALGRSWLIPFGLILIFLAWSFVTAWYLTWGLLVAPWRLLRRGQRRNKQVRRLEAATAQKADPVPDDDLSGVSFREAWRIGQERRKAR